MPTLRRGRRGETWKPPGLLDRQVVWLVGSPRSGSTWLLNLLAGHDSIGALDEPLIGAHLGAGLAGVLGLGEGHGPGRILDEFRGRDSYFFADRYRDVWAPALGRMILERLAASMREGGGHATGELLVVKEPHGSEGIDMLMTALPEARVLFLIRDGRDVLDSMLDAVRPDAWAANLAVIDDARARVDYVEKAAHLWVSRTRLVAETVERAGARAHLVRYEDLLADTSTRLAAILGWLGLTMDDELAAHVDKLAFDNLDEKDRGSGRFARAATPGLWREQLSAEEQDVANSIMGPTLRELGYDV
jgi:sulfotransferase family protein